MGLPTEMALVVARGQHQPNFGRQILRHHRRLLLRRLLLDRNNPLVCLEPAPRPGRGESGRPSFMTCNDSERQFANNGFSAPDTG